MPIVAGVQLLKYRRTKIVATLGPSSSDATGIEQLIAAGVDVFRLNMSHGDRALHRSSYEIVRAAAAAARRSVAVLADLAGPKIRVGKFRGGAATLAAGATVRVRIGDVLGDDQVIPSTYANLPADVKPGDRILLADGAMELRVTGVASPDVVCEVIDGGILTDRKGMNLPGVEISAPSLTDADRDAARFAIGLGVDYLGLSFVRSPNDIDDLRALVEETGRSTRIVAKIERPEALSNIDEIMAKADAIMVARGDLGVELPPETVPVVQRELVDLGRRIGKPVIVATQMLESMVTNPTPTRAEVADVSHTVFSGTDAIMLSGETAVGKYPVDAVRMMDRIARQAEGYLWAHGAFAALQLDPGDSSALPSRSAVARSTAQLSRDLRVRAVMVVSERGISATALSAARPAAPIVGVAAAPQTCRWENLLWGVIPCQVDPGSLEQPTTLARRLARDLELARDGDYVLLVSGFRESTEQETPSITVVSI